jgi:hypothetical protein
VRLECRVPGALGAAWLDKLSVNMQESLRLDENNRIMLKSPNKQESTPVVSNKQQLYKIEMRHEK